MATVPLRASQNSEVLTNVREDPSRGARDRLHAIVVGGNAIDEIEGIGGVLGERLDRADLLELFVGGPVGSLLLHLAVWIATALECLQRLLEGLRNVAIVDHAPPQVHDLVDVLDQQRAFFLARAACGAGPDFVFGIDAADECLVIV